MHRPCRRSYEIASGQWIRCYLDRRACSATSSTRPWARGVLEPTPFVRCEIGVFHVRKKNQKLRVIFDPHLLNATSKEPSKTRLPSGESLSDIELAPGQSLCLSEGDVEDCYYQWLLPPSLQG